VSYRSKILVLFVCLISFFCINKPLKAFGRKYQNFDQSIDFVYVNAMKFIKIIGKENSSDIFNVDKNNPLQVLFEQLKKEVDSLLELKVSIKNIFDSKSFKDATKYIEELRLLKNDLDKLCDLNRLNKKLNSLQINDPIKRAIVFIKNFTIEVEEYKKFVGSNFYKPSELKYSLEEFERLINQIQSFCVVMNSVLDKMIILLNSDFSKNIIEFLNKWIAVSGLFPEKLKVIIGASVFTFTILAIALFVSCKIWLSNKDGKNLHDGLGDENSRATHARRKPNLTIDIGSQDGSESSSPVNSELRNSVDDDEVLYIPGEHANLPVLPTSVMCEHSHLDGIPRSSSFSGSFSRTAMAKLRNIMLAQGRLLEEGIEAPAPLETSSLSDGEIE